MENGANLQNLLRLMQLSDSAVPIGGAAHSWGLETLTDERLLTVAGLASFLQNYLGQSGRLEVVFARAAYQLEQDNFEGEWRQINQTLAALKPGRESRAASTALGRRLVQLVLNLEPGLLLQQAAQSGETHYCLAFGLVGKVLAVEEDLVMAAYLQQSLAALVSACQRLLPLGQTQASSIMWQLKPAIAATVAVSRSDTPATVSCFTAGLDIAVMRHPTLGTRLFIS